MRSVASAGSASACFGTDECLVTCLGRCRPASGWKSLYGRELSAQSLGRMRQEVAVLVDRAALHRHAVPHGGDRGLEPGRAIDDEELRPQPTPDEIVEHRAPGLSNSLNSRPNRCGRATDCAAAILRAPGQQDGELLQDGTTGHLDARSKHPKRQAGPAVSAPGSACPYPLLAVPASWVVLRIDAPWKTVIS